MNMFKALRLLGDCEVTQITSVADLTVLAGFLPDNKVNIVVLVGDEYELLPLQPVENYKAALSLMVSGDDQSTAACYELAEQVQPQNQNLRWIP